MWYDFFSLFYDKALEKRYREARGAVVDALGVTPGSLVLDIACGTGQNFPLLQQSLGEGTIIGIDASRGMLRRAEERVQRAGWTNVHLVHADIHAFGEKDIQALVGETRVDFLICTLGLTVIPRWEEAFARSYALLKKGGRVVLFDAYADTWVLQTWASKWAARADLSRRFWEPLEVLADEYQRVRLPGSPHEFGGHLYLASGQKPLTQ